jgi:adenylate cyclase
VGETRKLAAILVSDVVGYSRLAGADEDRILARLRTLRSDLIDPTIAVHHGRVVKRTGDGAIVEFRSVVDAVSCAVEIQRAMVERNAEVAPDKRIEFRIGIHLGDVVEEADGDLMGDGVNVAARLEGICEPAGICLSEDAYRQVKSRLEFRVADLGPQSLKNITEPIRAYLLRQGTPEAVESQKGAEKRQRLTFAAAIILLVLLAVGGYAWHAGFAPLPRISGADNRLETAPHLSIVVLPFRNFSSDPSQDRLADSLTDNLTSELSRIRNSYVIARNTAFTFKDKSVDAKEIGKQLDVRYLLEGSIDRSGERMRVNAQLIDAQSGAHLWSDRLEENSANAFELQDRFLERLAAALREQLVIAEADKAARTTNPDAVDFAMRGRALMQAPRPNKEQNDAAIAMFDQALKLNPDEPDALAGLALAYGRTNVLRWGSADLNLTPKILALSERALELDPHNVTAYIAKSIYYYWFDPRLNEVIRIANAGLAIDANSAALHAARGAAEQYLGRSIESLADVEEARRLNAHDPEVMMFGSSSTPLLR